MFFIDENRLLFILQSKRMVPSLLVLNLCPGQNKWWEELWGFYKLHSSFKKRMNRKKKNILKDTAASRKYFAFDCEHHSFRLKGVVFMLPFKEASLFSRMPKVEGESYAGKKQV